MIMEQCPQGPGLLVAIVICLSLEFASKFVIFKLRNSSFTVSERAKLLIQLLICLAFSFLPYQPQG